ncbi:LYAR-type C2HC zinc finger-domain-containing protein [Zychaea mexicana]|uniref:LYAR-type C2HC zinc finger-domain-containing protein n=1 Tax=Zychaea mexicana TaxID=64656 RepID=UPI0022FE65DD|nr:LYAR-type C2HC zinc finger-domain-containing protein [Zychaea mexicana]KAI9497428.1 LYAR-type C2HC zinc finger-domain-containing protein [Zychaea mexicana]
MVSFQCDNCGDIVKKPKLDQHRNRCHATFTCIDCSTTFQGTAYKAHTSCISEAEKYQKSLYKKKGNNKNNNNSGAKNGQNNNNNKKQEPQQKQEEKQQASAPAKPLSLVDELKKKKATEASTGEKRMQEDEEEDESNKKAKNGAKWEETELPGDAGKAVEFALREALRTSKSPLSIKDARKKAIKLLTSHPKSKNKDKKDLKEKFDESLLLIQAGDVVTVKTA